MELFSIDRQALDQIARTAPALARNIRAEIARREQSADEWL